jgi:hypothetical protein
MTITPNEAPAKDPLADVACKLVLLRDDARLGDILSSRVGLTSKAVGVALR